MNKKILTVICGAILTLTVGCEFDHEGRARFTERQGSLKDTQPASSEQKRSNRHVLNRQVLNKEAASPSSEKKLLRSAQSDQERSDIKTEKKTLTQLSVQNSKNVSQNDPVQKQVQEEKHQAKPIQDASQKKLVIKTVPSSEKPLIDKSTDPQKTDLAAKKVEPAKQLENPQPQNIQKEAVQETQQDQNLKTQNQSDKAPSGPEQKSSLLPEKNVSLEKNAQNKPQERVAGSDVADDKAGEVKRGFNSGLASDGAKPQEAKSFVSVKVHYATDRNLTGQNAPNSYYGSERSVITYGVCEVSIPKKHKTGALEAPSIWRFEVKEVPEKHVVLLNILAQNKTDFFADLKKRIDLSNGKNSFLFVHGYNVDFSEAARRTAQIAYDLNFDGAPIFYSWPSRGNLTDYVKDEATVEWTGKNIKKFVRDFALRSDADNIYLIAHSMGSRALTQAVAELVSEMPGFKKRFKEVILAAPDIDADVFRRDIAPKLIEASKNVTLYAASDDKAIQISRTIHGQPRAGDAGPNLMIVDGIDTVDSTGIDTSFFKHSYFADAPSILSDLHSVINFGTRPGQRGALKKVVHPKGGAHYWTFLNNKTIIINGDASVAKNETTEIRH